MDERGKGRLNLQPQMDTDKHGFFQARQGWHICSLAIHQRTKLRQERHHPDVDGRCRPDGAENYFGLGFYKYAAPDGAGDGRENSPAIYGWVRRQSNEKSREGRQKIWWPSASGGRAQAPFVPDGTWENCGPRVPAMNGWAIFSGARASARFSVRIDEDVGNCMRGLAGER